MKYFEVKKEELAGTLVSGTVLADGDWKELPDDVEARYITTGFSVYIYGDNGMIETIDYYPVKTDTESWEDDEEEVLERIKSIYSADNGWQNNDW